MLTIADDDPPSAESLTETIEREMCWVYETPADGVVAYLAAIGLRGSLHIEQVSVHPEFARLRYGAQLIEHAGRHAAALGYPLLTLTTFTEVPWNAPYYARLGFRELHTRELGEVLSDEEDPGSGSWPRIGMARRIAGGDSAARHAAEPQRVAPQKTAAPQHAVISGRSDRALR